MLYGLLNVAGGVGYVTGGLVGVPLLSGGCKYLMARAAYETTYGTLIIFPGLSSDLGGAGILWKSKQLLLMLR